MLHLLGIGLLHQGAPELIASVRVAEEQTALAHWQTIVHHHFHPLTILPELSRGTETQSHTGHCLLYCASEQGDYYEYMGVTWP